MPDVLTIAVAAARRTEMWKQWLPTGCWLGVECSFYINRHGAVWTVPQEFINARHVRARSYA